MGTCASCGTPMRDDDWSCGRCGAPVASAAAGTASAGARPAATRVPDYEPAIRPAIAAPARGGLSRTTVLVLIAAAVVVVAIVTAWFLFVRGGSGEFGGVWRPGGSDVGEVVIKGAGDDYKVTISGTDSLGTQQSYTVPAHRDGGDLVITIDDFVEASGNEAEAEAAKATFEAVIKDFRLVFRLKDPIHLEMTVEGTTAGGTQVSEPESRSIVLVKVE